MKARHRTPNLPALLAGMLLGSGVSLLAGRFFRRNPDLSPGQVAVDRAMDRALQKSRAAGRLVLTDDRPLIVFSDHHKGARSGADDFQASEPTYLSALDHYHAKGFTLVVLGDAEELWEERISAVLAAYPRVFQSEARFHPERMIRILGNHDDAWESPALVHEHLGEIFPQITFFEGIVLAYKGDRRVGELFLTHGHQGTWLSDTLRFFGPLFLPYFRLLQILTGVGRTSPSNDACLRAEQDTRMYRWARRQKNLILVAGHTHRPIWSSLTHLEMLLWKLQSLRRLPPGQQPPDFDIQVRDLQNAISLRQERYPPCSDTVKTLPCYFNTGCCSFQDGDITGIEIEAGRMRLVKWARRVDQAPTREVLEQASLADLFAML